MDTRGVKTQETRRRPRVFYGWWIVLVCFLSEIVFGASTYIFPIFYKPMALAMDWSRTTVAVAPSLRTVVNALISPVIGPLVDRHGPRVIMLIGAILLGGAGMAMLAIREAWQYLLVYGVLGSVAFVAGGQLATVVTVSKWFVRKRGRATAFVVVGVSLAGVIFTPVGTYVVGKYDWRAGWAFLGVLTWIVLIPASLVMRRQPEDMGLLPDGEEPRPSANPAAVLEEAQGKRRRAGPPEEVWTLQQAIRSRTFWLVLIGLNLASMGGTGVLLHQFPFLTDKGFPPAIAATAVTAYAFLAMMTKLVYGFISERVHIRYLVMVSWVGGSFGLAFLTLATPATPWLLYVYVVVYGLTIGAYALLIPLIWANYFGRTFQGTIRGVTTPFSLISNAGGPLFAAWVYDVRGSYDLAFTIYSITYLLGAFFMFLAKPTKPPQLASPQSSRGGI